MGIDSETSFFESEKRGSLRPVEGLFQTGGVKRRKQRQKHDNSRINRRKRKTVGLKGGDRWEGKVKLLLGGGITSIPFVPKIAG